MDETIEGLVPAWVDWLNEKHGLNVAYNDVTDWDMTKFFPEISKAEVYKPLLSGEEFWENVKVYPDAVYNIRMLKEDGHKVYIVTASDYRTIQVKMETVLFKNFPFLRWEDVIVTSNKQIIECDVMVDDGYHNLEGGKYFKILLDKTYNRNLTDEQEHSLVRCSGWYSIYDTIKTVSLARC